MCLKPTVVVLELCSSCALDQQHSACVKCPRLPSYSLFLHRAQNRCSSIQHLTKRVLPTFFSEGDTAVSGIRTREWVIYRACDTLWKNANSNGGMEMEILLTSFHLLLSFISAFLLFPAISSPPPLLERTHSLLCPSSFVPRHFTLIALVMASEKRCYH